MRGEWWDPMPGTSRAVRFHMKSTTLNSHRVEPRSRLDREPPTREKVISDFTRVMRALERPASIDVLKNHEAISADLNGELLYSGSPINFGAVSANIERVDRKSEYKPVLLLRSSDGTDHQVFLKDLNKLDASAPEALERLLRKVMQTHVSFNSPSSADGNAVPKDRNRGWIASSDASSR
jgi:hypothetical protein